MKKMMSVLAGILGLLFIVGFLPMVQQAAAYDYRMDVAESQAVDTGGTPFLATPSTHYMDVTESQAVDTSGTPFIAAPSTHYMDVAESQAVDTGGTRFVAAPSVQSECCTEQPNCCAEGAKCC